MHHLFRGLTLMLGGAVLAAGMLRAQQVSPDVASANPIRGKLALTEKGCITCHSVWGVGGRLGPDLATAGADQSFQQLAAMFWNHTPRMVQMLKQRGTEWPVLTEQEMADIISFIYFLKLIDQPGDATQGRILFAEKKCQHCHAVGQGSLSLARIGAFKSPVPMAQAMWNAGRSMHENQQERSVSMPLFQGREMADIQAYIRSRRGSAESRTVYLPLPDLAQGSKLFRSKGCASCHQSGASGPDLSRMPLRRSMAEICGILWNHSFAMHARITARGIGFPSLAGNELADILGYIYFLHFSRDLGDAGRGERIFKDKGCANCHGEGGEKKGPDLGEGAYDILRLATSMWNHAPIMHESMANVVMQWIKLDPDDMQDLSKYLKNAGK